MHLQFCQVQRYLRSNIDYNILCGRFNATCYCETCQHLSVRVGEHSVVSPLIGKKSESKNPATVKEHMLFYNHIVSIDNFKTLATSDSDFHVKGELKIWKQVVLFPLKL